LPIQCARIGARRFAINLTRLEWQPIEETTTTGATRTWTAMRVRARKQNARSSGNRAQQAQSGGAAGRDELSGQPQQAQSGGPGQVGQQTQQSGAMGQPGQGAGSNSTTSVGSSGNYGADPQQGQRVADGQDEVGNRGSQSSGGRPGSQSGRGGT
jgi:hypothetical protein